MQRQANRKEEGRRTGRDLALDSPNPPSSHSNWRADQPKFGRRDQQSDPPPRCPAHRTLEDVDVQDAQPDGAHNPEPMAARQLCMFGAEASSRKPWTKVYSADRGWW
jgi:hypothetical protein